MVLALAAAVPLIGALYLARRRAQSRRPSGYALNRSANLRRIRATIDMLVAQAEDWPPE